MPVINPVSAKAKKKTAAPEKPKESSTQFEALCNTHNLTISSRLLAKSRVETFPGENKQPFYHDLYEVTITRAVPAMPAVASVPCGCGDRNCPNGGGRPATSAATCLFKTKFKQSMRIDKEPTVVGVLKDLLGASAESTKPFATWCASLKKNSDSIKVLNSYREARLVRKGLLAMLQTEALLQDFVAKRAL
jgi:hypothetical protein